MMVSTKGRYALMVLLDLAEHNDGTFISLSDVSARQNLSMKYLESVVALLNKGGLLQSLRGKNGGYRLNREPEEYKVAEILKLTEGSLASVECLKTDEMECERAGECRTLPLWVGLDNVIYNYLENITLRDVMTGNANKSEEFMGCM